MAKFREGETDQKAVETKSIDTLLKQQILFLKSHDSGPIGWSGKDLVE